MDGSGKNVPDILPEDVILDSVFTDASGNYQFNGLLPGSYAVMPQDTARQHAFFDLANEATSPYFEVEKEGQSFTLDFSTPEPEAENSGDGFSIFIEYANVPEAAEYQVQVLRLESWLYLPADYVTVKNVDRTGGFESNFEFEEQIHGGSVPKNYFPAVEKGLIETFQAGPLAGYPVIGVKAILIDGAYHDVDSNEISFKLAASLAFKNVLEKAQATLLEPIMKLAITIKDDYVGDVMGDINKRRGRVLGIEPLGGGKQRIDAEVPEVEIVRYTTDLKAMTQGTGQFTREFARYEEVPDRLQQDIIAEANKED